MKYLTLSIRTDERGVLYEKDVEPRNLFELFIRSVVTSLMHEETIFKGEHYCAIIIPRYGDYLHRYPVKITDPARVAEKTGWIEMRFEDPVKDNQPVRYFTIELRIKERNLVYREDFQPYEVGTYYVASGIEQALLDLGVLKHREYYHTLFFARDDDHARFDRERMPALEKQASSLVELTSDQPVTPTFPYRDPTVFGKTETIGDIASDDIRVYIKRDAYERLVAEGRYSVEVERGGILVGDIYENNSFGRRIVEINDLIISEHTTSSVSELRYTFQSWQAGNALMKEKFPNRRIVGWYHTHLIELSVYPGENRGKTEKTGLFFSREDLFLHKQFFPDEWYVAMVLDPRGKSIFFQWKDNEVVPCGGYQIFEDVGIAR